MKLRILEILCLAMLAAGLTLALTPHHGNLNNFMPDGIRKWVNNDHDEEENVIAFFLVSSCALCPAREMSRGSGDRVFTLRRLWGTRAFRMALLMILVCVIELVQMFIPGRVPDLHDVCTGWSGVFSGALLAVLVNARGENLPIE